MNTLKGEIVQLRSQLTVLNRQKENLFSSRHQVSVEIRKHIGEIKQEKHQRDSLTQEVKLSKTEREAVNKKIKDLVAELTKLHDEKQALIIKLKLQEDPSEIRLQMKKLEHLIETGGISFEKEKEFMTRIKKMKKKYDEAKEITVFDDKARTIKKELDTLRSLSDSAHHSVQETAQKSQKFHEEMMSVSKEIDSFRKKEDELTKQYEAIKAQMAPLGEELDRKNMEIDKIRETLQQNNVELRVDQQKSHHDILRQKEAVLNDKMKNKKTLTTEDILVFQKMLMKGGR